MFRRRGSMRPLRRFPADIPPALQRANELMAIGDYAGAAIAYEQLAQGAVARRGPRAPWLLLQAGRMRLLAGPVETGLAYLRQGLELFADRGQWQPLYRSGQRAVAELKQQGLTQEAAQIEALLRARLPSGFAPAAAGGIPGKPKPVLPTNCPGCGAPVRTDEVEWVDEVTVACPYCGSAVRAEG